MKNIVVAGNRGTDIDTIVSVKIKTMAKGIKCFIIVNTNNGYCFQKEYFDSINKAVEYGRNFFGGFAWRIYNAETNKFIKSGFCIN